MEQHHFEAGGGNTDFSFNRDEIIKWVQSGITDDTVKTAEKFGKHIANKNLTTSQIRSTFGEMRRIQLNGYKREKTAFLLLKPKLAYAVKRHGNKGLDDFYKFFSIAYDAVNKDDDNEGSVHFNNLMNLLEAVLAYHKFHGGRE
jgi:CRISPR-associated protein Csm2